MKRLAIILIACGLSAAGYCQSRTGAYNRVVSDRWDAKKDVSVATTIWRNGTIRVSRKLIIIDSAHAYRKVYTMVSLTSVEDYCYDDSSDHAGIQFFTVLELTAPGFKLVNGYFLYKDNKKKITDVIFQPEKNVEVTYTFNTD